MVAIGSLDSNEPEHCTKNVPQRKFSSTYQRVKIEKPRQSIDLTGLIWWARTDLNRGPKDYESSALTN